MKTSYILNTLTWAILALPAIGLMIGYSNGSISAHDMLHPTGEFAGRFLIITMMITPLRMIFSKAKWLFWLSKRRRWIGVASFGYAALHTWFYIVDKGGISPMLAEFTELGIWTGWLAFAIFIPLAVTSNDASQKWLLSRWKQVQRWVYPAAVLTLVHWIFVHNEFGPALVHFAPLAALESYRIWKNYSDKRANAAVY